MNLPANNAEFYSYLNTLPPTNIRVVAYQYLTPQLTFTPKSFTYLMQAGALAGIGLLPLTGPPGDYNFPEVTVITPGPQGETGAAGLQGPPGTDGIDGENGADGLPGPTGLSGAAGAAGATGSTGLMGLAGPPGMDGLDGIDGEQGLPGAVGLTGLTGPTGSTGPAGTAGLNGIPGFDGMDGLDGFDGMPGVAGPAGATGSPGATGPAGLMGPMGFPGQDAEEPELPYIIPGPKGDTGPAGGGGGSATTVEVNLGTTPVTQGKFTIIDASITAAKKILVWQAPGPYTGKGTLADEAALVPVDVLMVEPLAGSAVIRWQAKGHVAIIPNLQGDFGAVNSVTNQDSQTPDNPRLHLGAMAIGKVRGNVKFSYLVFA